LTKRAASAAVILLKAIFLYVFYLFDVKKTENGAKLRIYLFKSKSMLAQFPITYYRK